MERPSVRHKMRVRWGVEGTNDRTAFFEGIVDLGEMPWGAWYGVAQIECTEEAAATYRADALLGSIVFEIRLDDGRMALARKDPTFNNTLPIMPLIGLRPFASGTCEKCGSVNLEQGVFEIPKTPAEPRSLWKRLLSPEHPVKKYALMQCSDCGHLRPGNPGDVSAGAN